MKTPALIIVLLFGGLMVYCALAFPRWGDPSAPASIHVSPRYIEQSFEKTTVPNIVTAVLADYRGYDTMFETIVIFSAGVACIVLLRMLQGPARKGLYRHIPSGITLRFEAGAKLPPTTREFERIDLDWVPYDVVIRTACRLIVPLSQIFAIYVIAHGHYSPGGGLSGRRDHGGVGHSLRHLPQSSNVPEPLQ